LPVGVQLIGPMFEDCTPLRLAELLEQRIGGFQAPEWCVRSGRPYPRGPTGPVDRGVGMTRTPTPLSDELFDYLCAHGTPPDPVQSRLIAEPAALGHEARLQVSPDEGTFLTLLTELIGARTALEIGTFTGYSALAIARGLGEGGRLTCLDISEEWTR